VVRLVPLPAEQRPQAHPNIIDRIVRAAFGQRRKTLSNALRGVAGANELVAANIDPRARAEQLAPSGFVALARIVESRADVGAGFKPAHVPVFGRFPLSRE
jgi:16S rRNA (adenine1518-N6/adenine1519-N6)-dimethyltransferase